MKLKVIKLSDQERDRIESYRNKIEDLRKESSRLKAQVAEQIQQISNSVVGITFADVKNAQLDDTGAYLVVSLYDPKDQRKKKHA